MLIRNFTEYNDSLDKTKIPIGALASPSKNVNIIKGEVITDLGNTSVFKISNIQQGIHSSYVFSSLGLQIPIRCFGSTMQIKLNTDDVLDFTNFITNMSGERVFFTTWTDNNVIPTKKRLVFADNSNKLYIWTGAFASVKSKNGNVITIDGNASLPVLGFDTPTTNLPLYVYRNNQQITGTFSYTSININNITLTDASNIQVGDILIQQPLVIDNVSSLPGVRGVVPQVVWNSDNHIFLFNQNSSYCPGSDADAFSLTTGFNFSIPSSNILSTSPYGIQLDSNFTLVNDRKDANTGSNMCILDQNTWYYPITTLNNNASDGFSRNIKKFPAGYNKGGKFMASTTYLGNIIYMALDNSIYEFTYNELGTLDTMQSISYNKIDNFLNNVNSSIVNCYFFNRILYFLFPNDNVYITFDTFEKHWNPPRYLNINNMFSFGGFLWGNNNSKVDTFKRFLGNTDFGNPIQSFIYTGYMYDSNISTNSLQKKTEQYTFNRHAILFKTDIGNTIKFGVNVDFDWNPQYYGKTFKTKQVREDDSSVNTFGDVPFGSDIFGSADLIKTDDLNTRYRLFDIPSSSLSTGFNHQLVLESAGRIQLLEYDIDLEIADNGENYQSLWIGV